MPNRLSATLNKGRTKFKFPDAKAGQNCRGE